MAMVSAKFFGESLDVVQPAVLMYCHHVCDVGFVPEEMANTCTLLEL